MDCAFHLQQQVALITGASSGIGRACAFHLARLGAHVVINHLPSQIEEANALKKEISAHGGRAIALAADVTDEAQVETLFADIVNRFGTLHILVNNAGIQQDSHFAKMTLTQWRTVLHVNLTGQFLCARAAVNEFLRRGMQPDVSCALGKIICVSSVHQCIPWAQHANYAASKGGVMLMMQTLAQEVASQKIRVNSIAPGAIRTPINHDAWATPDAMEKLLTLIPYGRIGEPEDVANAVAWLASDLSDYVNGTTLFIDGGMTLYPAFRENG